MKEYINYWAKLINEDMDSSEIEYDICNELKKLGWRCNVSDEKLVEVEIGPVQDNDSAIDNVLDNLYSDIDELNKKGYHVDIHEDKIKYDHQLISGDEDNPKSYKGVYICVPVYVG
jgi:hypothetical protein